VKEDLLVNWFLSRSMDSLAECKN